MKTIAIQSLEELEKGISSNERSFLLIHKRGAEQSDCALERIAGIDTDTSHPIFTADVNQVMDIHGPLEVSSAPSLLVFDGKKVVNILKGCQTKPAYDSVISGKKIGASSHVEGKKSKQVTVYTTPTCSWCTTIKNYLDQQGVRYREVNVAADNSAAEAMLRKSGQQGVPQTEIDGQMVVGFDKSRINQLLEIK